MAVDWSGAPTAGTLAAWPHLLATIRRNDATQGMSEKGTDRTSQSVLRDFEAFFMQYEGRITSFLWRMVGDEQTAIDLSQETFLRAWQQFANLHAYRQPAAWLFQVASHLALHHLRRQRKPVGAATPLDQHPELALNDPANQIAENEQVRQVLATLPANQRAALLLREVYGLSCAEIGTVLGVTRDTAKMTLSRARAQFRATYQEKEARR